MVLLLQQSSYQVCNYINGTNGQKQYSTIAGGCNQIYNMEKTTCKEICKGRSYKKILVHLATRSLKTALDKS